jgi:hypothetical protein
MTSVAFITNAPGLTNVTNLNILSNTNERRQAVPP